MKGQDFARYCKTCILLITFRVYRQKSEQHDHAWKLRPLFDHLLKHFLKAMQSESHQFISTCASSRVRVWCASTSKRSQSSGVLKFGFVADQSSDIYTTLISIRERNETLILHSVNQFYYYFVSVWRTPIFMHILIISSGVPRSWQSY